MAKYYHKSQKDLDAKARTVYEVEQVEKNTEIVTEYGPATITEGNYIFTDPSGVKFGVASSELEISYIEVKKSSTKG
jgi:hypothetical protein